MRRCEHRPGVQVYAGHGSKATRPATWAVARAGHLAVATRRRHLPGAHGVPLDAPNHLAFPVRLVAAGRRGARSIVYRFTGPEGVLGEFCY